MTDGEDEQVKKLLEDKAAFSAGRTVEHNVEQGSEMRSVVLRAQKEQIDIEAAKKCSAGTKSS